jgi:hypothetical protein
MIVAYGGRVAARSRALTLALPAPMVHTLPPICMTYVCMYENKYKKKLRFQRPWHAHCHLHV